MSIFPVGDPCDLIPDKLADLCILEEPEHLNWFRSPLTGRAWTDKFRLVVGVAHTNYLEYARRCHGCGMTVPFMRGFNQEMCRLHCHRVIKLSDTLQDLAPANKEVVCNVHGVRDKYLQTGDKVSAHNAQTLTSGAYFLGKLAWPKGLAELFDLVSFYENKTGLSLHVDVYGDGPHKEPIRERAAELKLNVTFHGGVDHSQLQEHRMMINPHLQWESG
eukprot:gene25373-31825_t